MVNKELHFEVIQSFLQFLNSITHDYVLKGGTSLMMCYNLDRFSEDIDLDSSNKNAIETIVKNFCTECNIQYRTAKNTDTVKRFMVHYGGDKPLKIEVSYRNGVIDTNRVMLINNITVYNIQTIFSMKLNAFNRRDKLRDLYDVCFIYKYYKNYLSNEQLYMLKDSFSFKGLEQFDFLIKDQQDDLIDNDKLAMDFLGVFNDFGLL